jgi:hypothetical protein
MVAFPVRPLFRFATTSLAEPRGHRPSLKFGKDSVRHRDISPDMSRDDVVTGGRSMVCFGTCPNALWPYTHFKPDFPIE